MDYITQESILPKVNEVREYALTNFSTLQFMSQELQRERDKTTFELVEVRNTALGQIEDLRRKTLNADSYERDRVEMSLRVDELQRKYMLLKDSH